MRIGIDVSIFTRSGGSFGHATGTLDLDLIPEVGDTLSFVFPNIAGAAIPRGFAGVLKVSDRVIDAAGKAPITLMLEDLMLSSVEDARAVSKYLADGFEVIVDVH
jgi:hypothetical protein